MIERIHNLYTGFFHIVFVDRVYSISSNAQTQLSKLTAYELYLLNIENIYFFLYLSKDRAREECDNYKCNLFVRASRRAF